MKNPFKSILAVGLTYAGVLVLGFATGRYANETDMTDLSRITPCKIKDRNALVLRMPPKTDEKTGGKPKYYTFLEHDGEFFPVNYCIRDNLVDAIRAKRDSLTKVIEEFTDSNTNGSYDIHRVFYKALNGDEVLVNEQKLPELSEKNLPKYHDGSYDPDERRFR